MNPAVCRSVGDALDFETRLAEIEQQADAAFSDR
jgi:hypothetical protein